MDGATRDLCRMRDDAISCDTKYSRIYVGSLEPWNALFCFFLWSTFCVPCKYLCILSIGELLNSVNAGQVTYKA